MTSVMAAAENGRISSAAAVLLIGVPCSAPMATIIATWIGVITTVSAPGAWASPPPTAAQTAEARMDECMYFFGLGSHGVILLELK